jgi:DNA-binding SARP family transcriptional activator
MSLRHGRVLQPSRGRSRAPELKLLGGFEVRAGGETLRLPLHAQRLLAFLALQQRPLHRTYIAGRLWLELGQGQANGCLRSTLWRVRRLPCRLVVATSSHIGLASEVVVDVHQLQAAVGRVLRGGSRGTGDDDLRCLVDAGELLLDSYEDWVLVERERLRQVRVIALESLAQELIEADRHTEATLAALAAVASDPLRESAHRVLVRCHLETGNAGEALRQFAAFRDQLARELGLEPSPAFQALLNGIG